MRACDTNLLVQDAGPRPKNEMIQKLGELIPSNAMITDCQIKVSEPVGHDETMAYRGMSSGIRTRTTVVGELTILYRYTVDLY